MFVDLSEIKGLLVELDSIPECEDANWHLLEGKVSLIFFGSSNSNRVDKITKRLPNCTFVPQTPFGGLWMRKNILLEILQEVGLASHEIAIFSSNKHNLVKCQRHPLATVLFLSQDNIENEDLPYLPDYFIHSVDEIASIITRVHVGYYSEAASIRYKYGEKIQIKIAEVVEIEREVEGLKYSVIIGGRYFKSKDARAFTHQLSGRILKNKKANSRQESVFNDIFFRLTKQYINVKIQQVDAITRIPPRPSEDDDRFIENIVYICNNCPEIVNLASAFRCVRDYESQKALNAEERAENIKGVFDASDDVRGKHIVLLDDVLTTGATIQEAVRTLYKAGAGRVTVLVLAVNQIDDNFRTSEKKELQCECGAAYELRFNSSNHSVFFGCSGYREGSCNETLSYFSGVWRYNIENAVSHDEADDNYDDLFEF